MEKFLKLIEIKKEHINFVRGLIIDHGKCLDHPCRDCPFVTGNSLIEDHCSIDFASIVDPDEPDDRLLLTSRDFLKFCEKNSNFEKLFEKSIDK